MHQIRGFLVKYIMTVIIIVNVTAYVCTVINRSTLLDIGSKEENIVIIFRSGPFEVINEIYDNVIASYGLIIRDVIEHNSHAFFADINDGGLMFMTFDISQTVNIRIDPVIGTLLVQHPCLHLSYKS